jgi:c-di-GMP-related signal transduction protein
VLIAKGVDTQADLDAAAQDGFECLEGFFFQQREKASIAASSRSR